MTAGVESELAKRLLAATMRFDWTDIPDDEPVPAIPLLREAAASLSQLHTRLATVERERDEARANHEYFATEWDNRGYTLKSTNIKLLAAEARAEASEAKLAEAVEVLGDLIAAYVKVSGERNDGFWNADAEPIVRRARSFTSSIGGKGNGPQTWGEWEREQQEREK